MLGPAIGVPRDRHDGGLGLAVAALLVVKPIGATADPASPNAVAAPSPSNGITSPDSGTLVPYANEEDGYALELPAAWKLRETTETIHPLQGVRRFDLDAAGHLAGLTALTIMVGQPSGAFYDCFGGPCNRTSAGSLDELARVIHVLPGEIEDRLQRGGGTTLGGEPARWESLSPRGGLAGGPPAYYTVMAMHGTRPVVLQFDYWPIKYGYWSQRTVDQIVASFHFIDSLERPTTSAWQTFTSTEAGIALELPTDWVEETDNDPQVVWVHGRGGGLRIRVGDAAGNILNCDMSAGSPCAKVPVTSVEDLVQLLSTTGRRTPWPFAPGSASVTQKATSLGTIPAVQMTVRAWESGPSGSAYTRHYVVAVDNGRPVVIKWEPGTFLGREFQQLLATFRFLDDLLTPAPTPQPSTTSVLFQDLGFVVALPEGCGASRDTGDPGVALITGNFGSATVLVGDEAGRIRTCLESSGPWEVCREVTATTLEELQAAVEPISADEHGVPVPGPVTKGMLDLDGEPAARTSVESYEYPAHGAEHVTYVVAFHHGRPMTLRFHTSAERPKEGWIADLLAGFQFLN